MAFYGMESIRFTAPVKIGDTIHCEVKVKSLAEKNDKLGIIDHENVIKNQRGEDVIVFITKILAGRKPQG
jgi:acyl dehydratase